MENQMFGQYPENEREAILIDNARDSEMSTHYRALTPAEIAERQKELLTNLTRLADVEEEKKAAMKGFADEIKDLRKTIADRVASINNRSEKVVERLYMFDDQTAGMMAYYNAIGMLAISRPLRPEERQMHIVSAIGQAKRDGTDG